MSDQIFDSRLETLLRDALKAEAASLPLRVGPDRVMDRAKLRDDTDVGARLRRRVLGEPNTGRGRLSMAVAAGAAALVLVVVGAFGFNFFVNQQGIGAPSPNPSPSPTTQPSADPRSFEPVGRQITCGNRNGIWSFNLAAYDPATWSTQFAQALGCSGDGARVLIQKGRENLFVLDADGSETQVTEQFTGFNELQPWARPSGATISPDGSRVVFAGLTTPGNNSGSCVDGALFAVDADGGTAELLWDSPENRVNYPTFSPDGTQIAFTEGNCDSDHSVWVMNADGSDAHQIVSSDIEPLGGSHVRGLAWSAPGDRIAIELSRGIYEFGTDGSEFKLVTNRYEFCWPALQCAPSPSVGPTTVPSPTVPGSPDPQTSGSMWPQSTEEEVRLAQERADARDPAYTWQVDPGLYSDESLTESGIIDRFLREVLGWDEFLYNVRQSSPEFSSSRRMGLVYFRCAPGETNPLYPVADEQSPGAEQCAPTIDDLHYESVRFNVDQPEQKGPTAVWVVGEWETSTFAQVDPRVADAQVTAQLEDWLRARIAGEGAEGKVDVYGDHCGGRLSTTCRIDDVPFLYATSSGARYARYEIERVAGPSWPYAEMGFRVRLFADDGAIVVEQPISWTSDTEAFDGRAGEFRGDASEMTEDGEPIAVPYGFFDGEMIASAARPWVVDTPGGNYGLSVDTQDGEARITFVANPRAVTEGCASAVPADAAALAQSIRTDSNFEATAPVNVIVGGAQGLRMDVTLAPGVSVCPTLDGDSRVIGWSNGAVVDHGTRLRLYLLDPPEGSRTGNLLAIAIAAPQARFDKVLEAAAPVLDSIEFHAP